MQRTSSSLAAVFLLMAVLAVLLLPAEVALLHPQRLDDWRVRACLVLGGLSGALIGGVVGAGQPRAGAAILLGISVGFLTGICGAALLASPWSLPAAAVGCGVLVVFAVVVRRRSGTPPRG